MIDEDAVTVDPTSALSRVLVYELTSEQIATAKLGIHIEARRNKSGTLVSDTPRFPTPR